MKEYLESIRGISLIKSITTQQIESFFNDGSFMVTTYGKNNIVHFAGESCLKLEIIISGQVVIERIDKLGNFMIIAEFHKGDVLGGNLMFSKKPNYPMTVIAKRPTIMLSIYKERLVDLLFNNHEFLLSYLQFVSDNTVILGDRIKHYVHTTIREKILSYLRFESERQSSNKIVLNMTKKALADRLGVQRTSLSRELAKMRDEGLIVFDSVTIEILYCN